MVKKKFVNIKLFYILQLLIMVNNISTNATTTFQPTPTATPSVTDLEIITRQQWRARPPTEIQAMPNPVPYVVIHHSYSPPACYNETDCIRAMQSMQDFHQHERHWADIGYSFAVGGDGRAYEGRGWSRVGAHAPIYNRFSIGICVIGDWRAELPPQRQMEAARELIRLGVETGMISADYKLVGHRQVRGGTTCPGDIFFREIGRWDHYTEHPEFFYPPVYVGNDITENPGGRNEPVKYFVEKVDKD